MVMRILIAGGQAPIRSALRLFLQDGHGWQVVGEAADSDELLAELEDNHPTVVLLEWELPGKPAGDLLPALRGVNSGLTVVVLSGRRELEVSARAAGADHFLSLGDSPRRLLSVLQDIQESMGPD
jgi:DNA-binding NarL/FixJ family response regulator